MVRSYSLTVGLQPSVSESGDSDVAGAVTAALAALADVQNLPDNVGNMVTADVLAQAAETETAINDIQTQFGAAADIKVFIEDGGAPTQAQIAAALEKLAAMIRAGSEYTDAYYNS